MASASWSLHQRGWGIWEWLIFLFHSQIQSKGLECFLFLLSSAGNYMDRGV